MTAALAIVAASAAAVAASAIATGATASAATVAVTASVATADRAATAKSHVLKISRRAGSKHHGIRRLLSRRRFQWRCWRRRCTPAVLPAAQDLPVLRRERSEDRLQGHQAPAALHLRARQDRAEPHHRGIGQEAA